MRDSTEERCKGQVEVFQVGKVAEQGRHSTRERNVGEVKMSQAVHRTQELREHTSVGPLKEICAKVEVLQITQRKQGRTYLPNQKEAVEIKLDNMACLVVTGDAGPSAAILVSPPRGEEVAAVVGDALLERQEGILLAWHAACGIIGTACGIIGTAGSLKLLRCGLRVEEEAEGCDDEEHQLGSQVRHGGVEQRSAMCLRVDP